MKLLFIANANSIHTHRFVKELANRGYNIYILSIAPNRNRIKYENLALTIDYKLLPYIPFLNNIIKFLRFIFFSLWINRIVEKYEIDGVVGINLAYGGAIAAKIKTEIKKIGITLGGEFVPKPFYNPEYFFQNKNTIREIILNLDYIITGDEESHVPILKGNNWHIKNNFIFLGTILGVDLDKFTPDNRDPILKKTLFGLEQDAILALCFREPRSHFDFENIIKAISKLVRKYKNLYFAIGKGNTDCRNLMDLAKKLCIEKNILFVENVSYSDLGKYLAQGDIFIDPINIKKYPRTAYVGVSQALIESMACGLIPVISNRPSIKWILPIEASPFIYNNFQSNLCLAIERAIKEKDNENIKQALRNAIIQKANEKNIMDIIVSLLEK